MELKGDRRVFQSGDNKPRLFTEWHNGIIAFIFLSVDDILVASNSLGKLFWEIFLGMKITGDRKNEILTVIQEEYNNKMLQKFDLRNSHPCFR